RVTQTAGGYLKQRVSHQKTTKDLPHLALRQTEIGHHQLRGDGHVHPLHVADESKCADHSRDQPAKGTVPPGGTVHIGPDHTSCCHTTDPRPSRRRLPKAAGTLRPEHFYHRGQRGPYRAKRCWLSEPGGASWTSSSSARGAAACI